MSIRYDKLFSILQQRGYTLNYWLRQNGLHTSTVSKLKKNERVNTDTINTICRSEERRVGKECTKMW